MGIDLGRNNSISPLNASFAECRSYTRHFARSFYFSSFLLPWKKRYASYTVYTFCRYVDNIVDMDGSHSPDERFKSMYSFLNDVYSGSFNPSSGCAFAETVKEYRIPKDYFTDLIEGVKMDIKKKKYGTYTELEEYCYKVASVVGLIMCEIFGYSNKTALAHAIDLGRAMQLTNILRDIKEDFKMGRVYLPEEELDIFGYTADDIRNGVVNGNFRRLMEYQIRRARHNYGLAKKGIPYLTNDGSRTTVVMMSKIYSGILDRIEKNCYDVYSTRAYVSILDKIKMTGKYLINFSEKKRYSRLPDKQIIGYEHPGFQSIER